MTRPGRGRAGGGDRFLRRSGNLRVRRERRWKRLTRRSGTLLVLSGMAVGAAMLVEPARALMFESDLFAVRQLVFRNRQRAELKELTELARPAASGNLFRIDLAGLEARLAEHPWVLSVRARRRLPDTVQVTIEERKPRAVARVDGRLQVIDAEGIVVGPVTGRVPPSLPVLVGAPGDDGSARRRAYRRGVRLLEEIGAFSPELVARVERVDLAGADRIDVYLNGDAAALRFPPDEGLGMLPMYLKIQKRVRARVPAAGRIDLRWRGQITVSNPDGRSIEG